MEPNSTEEKMAKLAGFLFLFLTVGSTFHHSTIDLNLIVSGNTDEIIRFIKENEFLFRIGIVVDIMLFISVLLLSLLLYTILKTINRHLALFALLCLLVQTALTLTLELSSFIGLLIVNGKGYLSVFEPTQLEALLALSMELRAAGLQLILPFFAIGYTVFIYLFLKSGYLPKWLAIFGIFSFALMLITIITKMLFPQLTGMAGLIPSLMVMIFQLIIGFWLLLKGISIKV